MERRALMGRRGVSRFLGVAVAALVLMALFPLSTLAAEGSVCAEVKIEINQELTLERQAFDAHMRINNGLTLISLQDVRVDVAFSDAEGGSVLASSDPNNTQALFFIRIDSLEGISAVDGTGAVQPASAANIHWLIIPATGAAKGAPDGTLYYVGATLTYTIGGEEHVTEVTPDHIFVKPMPELALDYFLPTEVYGDDAFTPEIEPPVPFSLGVRVSNNGQGVARSLKISSAQPKIVDNTQGLLVGFAIESCEVNGKVSANTLLVDFGDIQPARSATARWEMSCTLSGEFTEFKADYSHSDELGGELTSLLEATRTHVLVRDVLVDVSGRDGIRDFLAKEGTGYRVYESDSVDTDVTDQSAQSSLAGAGDVRTLTTPPTAGFMYVRLPDPHNGQKVLREVIRSDGKIIKPENAWLSKTRNAGHTWDFFFNVFDENTTGTYTVSFGDAPGANHPPLLGTIPNRTVMERDLLSFIVQATDPDGTTPSLAASPLPAGARFTDQGTGLGTFSWTPAVGQAGLYQVAFSASDGELTDSRLVAITVTASPDRDNDRMDDAWEMEKFGTLGRDGTGDFDHDGISDLDEFLRGTDPTVPNHAPTVPRIQSPAKGAEVGTLRPALTIQDSTDAEGDAVTYVFEVYADEGLRSLVSGVSNFAAGAGTTSWTMPVDLTDNTRYFWRARATDGFIFSQWTYGSFFVNTANDPPGAFRVSSPSDGSGVDTLTLRLEVTNSRDVDGDALSYSFLVYAEGDLTSPVASISQVPEGQGGTTSWVVSPALADGTRYLWKAVVTDEHGASVETPLSSFLVDRGNLAPGAPALLSPSSGSEVSAGELDVAAGNAVDPEGAALTYLFELDRVNTFDSPTLRRSGAVSEGSGSTSWHVSGLDDNTRYFWRVKASDGSAESGWTVASFFVNAANEAPSVPTLKNPGRSASVGTLTPTLSLNPSLDPDGDSLRYRFEVYADSALTTLIAQGESQAPEWPVAVALEDGAWHFFRAQAVDEHGLASAWTEVFSFFVKQTAENVPPEITLLEPGAPVLTNGDTVLIRWDDSDPDSNADVSLFYDTNASGEDGTLIVSGLKEDPDGASDTYLWDISGIPDGTYYVYGTIDDGTSQAASYSPFPVVIDRTPPALSAEPPAGTYSSARTVTLSASEPAEIYYTIDGSEPTTASLHYGGPIEVTASTTLKVIAVDPAGNQSAALSLAYGIGEGELAVTVLTDKGRALSGVKVYAFTESGSYTGKSATTDAQGLGSFQAADFAAGVYKFRVDYLGSQFWSELVTLPETSAVQVVIAEEAVEVTVTSASGPSEGVTVYVFDENGSYLGISAVTDANGRVSFDLPVGKSFRFRTDLLGNQYWSEVATVSGGGGNAVPVATGGGLLRVSVAKAPGEPLAGIKAYLFGASGSYLGLSQVTDASGVVGFNVSEGTYKVRADYLGYQFWSAETSVTEDTAIDLTIPHQEVKVTVEGLFQGSAQPLPGLTVNLFSPGGAYLGLSQQTDGQGRASFALPEQAYKVRVDYLGGQFWSQAFTWLDTRVQVPLADAEVAVSGIGAPLSGVTVYVFSSGSYLGVSGTTGSDGKVLFRLPAASYTFRADYEGNQYWSDEEALAADQVNPVPISTGGGAFTLRVLKDATEPLAGVKGYVFDESGSSLGISGTTDANGETSFDLADGSYTFRVDYLGYQFWSGTIEVPAALDLTITITHRDMAVTVEGYYAGDVQPRTGVPVYVFSPGGSYVGLSEWTDGNGKAPFTLPERAYKARADYLGGQFWSGEFTGEDTTVIIDEGIARVHVTAGGQDIQGAPVYVYSAGDSYLGLSGTTSASGTVEFRLPVGSYKFRADHQGNQYWASAAIEEDQLNTVEVTAGGGQFLFGVTTGSGPLVGVKVYVYSSGDSYLGISGTTDASGNVSFALSDGSYKFRVDYLGYQFWSPVYSVPQVLSDTLTIPHQEVAVTVDGFYLTHEPIQGVKVYLYTSGGSYLGTSLTTDAAGQVHFTLPEREYKVRVDYLGNQFWSDVFRSQDTTVTVNEGLARVQVQQAAVALPGVKVYLFSSGGSYLGSSKTTDANGEVEFLLPDRSFKFRADTGGEQYWSPVVAVTPWQENPVEIDVGASP
jgi:hypothetical protein